MSNLNAKYQNYYNRLESFKLWTGNVKPELLASVGFYLNDVGESTCYSCQTKLSKWDKDVNPWIFHMAYNPFCPHILINRKSFESEADVNSLEEKTPLVNDLTIFDKYSCKDVNQALESFMNENNYAPSTVTEITCIVEEFLQIKKLNKIAVHF